MIEVGTILFWTPDDATAPDQARDFCKTRGLTAQDVKILRTSIRGEAKIIVRTIRPCKVKVD